MIKCKEKCLALFSWGTLALGTVFIAILLYWVLYPYKVIDYYDLPYKMEDHTVEQGETTFYEIRYCKYMNVQATVDKWFVDGLMFQAEEGVTRLGVGCGIQKVKLHIPETLPPGNYKLRATATYQINPIRKIIATNETEWFQVLERN